MEVEEVLGVQVLPEGSEKVQDIFCEKIQTAELLKLSIGLTFVGSVLTIGS